MKLSSSFPSSWSFKTGLDEGHAKTTITWSEVVSEKGLSQRKSQCQEFHSAYRNAKLGDPWRLFNGREVPHKNPFRKPFNLGTFLRSIPESEVRFEHGLLWDC